MIRRVLAGILVALAVVALAPAHASAAGETPAPTTPVVQPVTPTAPAVPGSPATGKATVSVDLGGNGSPSQSVTILVLLTVLSLAPSLLVMTTAFTRIAIVLGLTRNALGLQGVPPNQVLVGLAMFLSFFVMSPTFDKVNEVALQPYMKGEITQSVAYDRGSVPVKAFMLKQTHRPELAMFVKASDAAQPKTPADIKMSQLVPAFVLSELKTAFLIGFVIFIPFLVIDLIVSSSLMSMGMMMLPPVLVSLPFKLLLFVLVDGWMLVVRSTLQSFVT